LEGCWAITSLRTPHAPPRPSASTFSPPRGCGEISGGSQRFDSYDLLKQRIEDHNLPLAAFQWYLDLRKYGSVPHAGSAWESNEP
jgi:asparaginyl-tRNA synthetase